MTPNLGEAAELLGTDKHLEPDDALDAARDIADRYGVVALVHGAVADPDTGDTWLDETGSAGLATSGSGDVLAGTVAGLLAREPARPKPLLGLRTFMPHPAGCVTAASARSVTWLGRSPTSCLRPSPLSPHPEAPLGSLRPPWVQHGTDSTGASTQGIEEIAKGLGQLLRRCPSE